LAINQNNNANMNDMDNESVLCEIFAQYQAQRVRYKHIGFSSKDISALVSLQTSIKKVLPEYDIWDGLYPNENGPEQGWSSFDFLSKIFHHEKELLILNPDSWLLHWSLLEQQSFWAQLSINHGSKNIVVVFNENYEFTKQNNHYFSPIEIPNTKCTLWISSKNSLAD
jgi:hypothetical protein